MLYLDGGCVDALQKLKTLLEMTTEAEELASAVVKSERLRSLVAEIRHKAKAEHDRLRQDPQQMETRYQLCMIGILEEFDFGKTSWPNVKGLEARLGRIHEEIDRTIREVKSSRPIM